MPQVKNTLDDHDRIGREVLWRKWTEDSLHGYWAEFGPLQKVKVEIATGSLFSLVHRRSITAAAGEMEATYRIGDAELQSKGAAIQIRTNYLENDNVTHPYLLVLSFDNVETFNIGMGGPNIVSDMAGNRLVRVAEAWKDSHVDKGIEWVSTVMNENYPWPETGIAIGLAMWAWDIYQDIVLIKYGRNKPE